MRDVLSMIFGAIFIAVALWLSVKVYHNAWVTKPYLVSVVILVFLLGGGYLIVDVIASRFRR